MRRNSTVKRTNKGNRSTSTISVEENSTHRYFQLIQDTMSGKKSMPHVYLYKRVAELIAEDLKTEFVSYTVESVPCRQLTHDEGAVGNQLVQIIRATADDMLMERIRKKLTKEERTLLGI